MNKYLLLGVISGIVLFSGCASATLKPVCDNGQYDKSIDKCIVVKDLRGVVKKIYDDVAFVELENGSKISIKITKDIKIGDIVSINLVDNAKKIKMEKTNGK